MDYSKIIKEVGRGKNHARDLDVETARALYSRMLNARCLSLSSAAFLSLCALKAKAKRR
ncbi:Anthranilate phosphoribosyltransferase like protein [Klebsiella oxytoca]|nr:Anthranilate phosphoribosyltransferase like protein [Klebsiella oxytoca]